MGNEMMNLHHIIQKIFPTQKTINFKKEFKQAQNILLLCDTINDYSLQLNTIQSFSHLFPKSEIHTLMVGSEYNHTDLPDKKKFKYHILSNVSLLKWIFSETLKDLKHCRFDICIDVNPNVSLKNFYTCRTLHPTICIGFNKKFSRFFYNFQFKTPMELSLKNKIQDLIQSIQFLLKTDKKRVKRGKNKPLRKT